LVDMQDFSLDVRARNRYYRFLPQFFSWDPKTGARYSPMLESTAVGFLGWCPYFNKRWPAGYSKLAFKEFCVSRALPTPAHWQSPAAARAPYLVKLDRSSLGVGIRGPFHPSTARPLADGAFCEEFVRGRMLKALYWDRKLLCLEVRDMPAITGDGRRTVRELMAASCTQYPPLDWTELEEVAGFQGVTLKQVLEEGRTLLGDFRYGSPLFEVPAGNANVLARFADKPLAMQLKDLGPVLWQSIPEEMRGFGTVYSVDAIVDEQDRVWLLEMNCNPGLHPDVYFGMFEGLFGPADPLERETSPALYPGMVPPVQAFGMVPPMQTLPTQTFARPPVTPLAEPLR
jgi:hypothetical protein